MKSATLVTVRNGMSGSQSYVVNNDDLVLFKKDLNNIILSETPVTLYKHTYQNKEYVQEQLWVVGIYWNVDGVMDITKQYVQAGDTLSEHSLNQNKIVHYILHEDGTAVFTIHVWSASRFTVSEKARCLVLDKARELNL